MPIGSQEGLDINAAVIAQEGLDTLAAQSAATEGQVPTVGSDGNVVFADGSSGGTLQQTTVITAAEFRGAVAEGIILIDPPGIGRAILDANLLFIADAGFEPFTGDFNLELSIANDFAGGQSVFAAAFGSGGGLFNFIQGAAPGDVCGFWFGTFVNQDAGNWSGPIPENCPFVFAPTASNPLDGAGTFTVVASYTVINLP